MNNTSDAAPDVTVAIGVIEYCPPPDIYRGVCAVCGEEVVVSSLYARR